MRVSGVHQLSAPEEHAAALRKLQALKIPETDPVLSADGPLTPAWQR